MSSQTQPSTSSAKKNPKITLLGNNSGRNLGDAAILSSILKMVSEELPDADFYVPSISPKFIDDNYGDEFKVKGINVMPWTGSMRLLGIPTMRCLAKSDVALICDGIIFGRKLFSPHNFLITLIFLVPWAKLFGCKVVCFSCGIGPFPTRFSELCARWVINLSDLVIMRENDSKKLAEELGVTKEVQVTGDAAFVNYVSSKERAEEIIKKHGGDPSRPLIGLNVTPYIDSWLKKSERVKDKSSFLDTIASAVLNAKERISEAGEEVPTCLIFSCSPMDEDFSNKLAQQVDGIVIDNSTYLSHDIQAVMRECGLLMGMRFHSLVLSSAVGTPIVGLVYAPKVRGYMRLLNCEDFSLELRELTTERLGETLANAWKERSGLQSQQQSVVDTLKKGARYAGTQIRERYFPKHEAPKNLSAEESKTAEQVNS